MVAKSRDTSRISIPDGGEFYMDLLTIDAWINGRTIPAQASTLLCAKLQEREEKIRVRIAYLAEKRGISSDELWQNIITGSVQELNPEDAWLKTDPSAKKINSFN